MALSEVLEASAPPSPHQEGCADQTLGMTMSKPGELDITTEAGDSTKITSLDPNQCFSQIFPDLMA